MQLKPGKKTEREVEKDRKEGDGLQRLEACQRGAVVTCEFCLRDESPLLITAEDTSGNMFESLLRLLRAPESISEKFSSVRLVLARLLLGRLPCGEGVIIFASGVLWVLWLCVWMFKGTCVPYFQLLRNPCRDTGEATGPLALPPAVNVGEGEQRLSPLAAAR
jgi:hypothetical protein